MARGVEVRVTGLEGLAYGRVRFLGTIPHGKREREAKVDIDADSVLRLADALRGCPHNFEEPRTGRQPRDLEEAKQSRFVLMNVRHAVWHLEHPDRPMPCRPDGEKLIDVEHPLAPSWSVVCDFVPKTIHVRDEGHVCRSPRIVDPLAKEVP